MEVYHDEETKESIGSNYHSSSFDDWFKLCPHIGSIGAAGALPHTISHHWI